MYFQTPFPKPPVLLKDILRYLKNNINAETFENNLKKKWLTQNIHLVKSARQAIWLAILSLKPKPGSEIIVSSFMCPVVPLAVLKAGCKPVFCDVIPDGFVLSFESVLSNITKKTIAIILPYSFGCFSDINAFKKIAKEYNIALIEDCSQTIRAKYEGNTLGFNADFGIWSFGIGKNIASLNGAAFWYQDKYKQNVNDVMKKYYASRKPSKNWHDLIRAFGIPIINSTVGYSLLQPLINIYQNGRETKRTNSYSTPEFDNQINDLEASLCNEQFMRYESIYNLKKSNFAIYKNELKNIAHFPNVHPHFEPDFLYAPILLDKSIRYKLLHKFRNYIVNDINFSYLDKRPMFKNFSFNTPNRLKVQEEYLLLSLHHKRKETIKRANIIKKFIIS